MLYLLDTVTARDVIRGTAPELRERLAAIPPQDTVAISSVTRAELLYAVAKHGFGRALASVVNDFMHRVTVLPWDSTAAAAYAEVRSACDRTGVALEPFDIMIAAHAKATGAILVTRDLAFRRVLADLTVEDWTT